MSEIKNIKCAKGEYGKIMRRFFYLLLASLIISTASPALASASSADSLIKNARSYLGVKYVYGGTTSSGFDCSGFTQVAFKNTGVSIPRTTGSQYSTGTPVAKSNLKTGDLVFFNTTGRGKVSHVGIYVGGNNFIHASTSRGVMVSSIYDKYYWGSRYVGARRVKDFSAADAQKVAAKPVAPKPAPIPYPTRADIADTLANTLALPAPSETNVFKDVQANHPKIEAISAVAEAGIFTGSNGSFMPDGKLTRAQLAKVLVEAFGLEGSTEVSFKDVSADHYAKQYIEILYHNKVTTGYENGNFGVNDPVTLNQFKTFIERASTIK